MTHLWKKNEPMNVVVKSRPILAAYHFHMKQKSMAILPQIASPRRLVRRRSPWMETGLLE